MGYVYVIGEKGTVGNVYKIGKCGTSVKTRVLDLQTGNPRELYIALLITTSHYGIIELLLHQTLSTFQIRGEWYSVGIEQIRTVLSTLKLQYLDLEIVSPETTFKINVKSGTKNRPTKVKSTYRSIISASLSEAEKEYIQRKHKALSLRAISKYIYTARGGLNPKYSGDGLLSQTVSKYIKTLAKDYS